MLEHADLQQLFPHGHPMLLVDRVEALDAPHSVVAIKAIAACEPCFARELRISAFPRSLLLESFGQTGALLLLGARSPVEWSCHTLMLTTIRDVVFHGDAFPGDVLRHTAHLETAKGDTIIVSGETRIGTRLLAQYGTLIATLRPRNPS